MFIIEMNKSIIECFVGVTTGASKLQWRFLARDSSLVFLQTEYKLIANHQNQDTIVARNEVLKFVKQK